MFFYSSLSGKQTSNSKIFVVNGNQIIFKHWLYLWEFVSMWKFLNNIYLFTYEVYKDVGYPVWGKLW